MDERCDGDVVIISFDPRFDSESAPLIETKLQDVLHQGNNRIVCDLKDTTYIASAGLKCLLLAAKRAKSQGGKVVLCSIGPKVREILEIAGFTQIFPVYPSADLAVAALKKPGR